MLVFAALGVACLDLSAPIGPASISPIQLPAKFVVRGDTMRDSAGTPAPPVVNQFNAKGQLIGGDAPQFFILDSAPAAHFDPTTGVLVGDHWARSTSSARSADCRPRPSGVCDRSAYGDRPRDRRGIRSRRR
jgi:hypothetical protein